MMMTNNDYSYIVSCWPRSWWTRNWIKYMIISKISFLVLTQGMRQESVSCLLSCGLPWTSRSGSRLCIIWFIFLGDVLSLVKSSSHLFLAVSTGVMLISMMSPPCCHLSCTLSRYSSWMGRCSRIAWCPLPATSTVAPLIFPLCPTNTSLTWPSFQKLLAWLLSWTITTSSNETGYWLVRPWW